MLKVIGSLIGDIIIGKDTMNILVDFMLVKHHIL